MALPPAIDGVSASSLQLPPGDWPTVLDGLCDRFPSVPRDVWAGRFARGRVLDSSGAPIPVSQPYRVGETIRYYREVAAEAPIPFDERIVFEDEDLLVAEKPHFLPVVPAGGFVEHTLLARLVRRTGNTDLVPLHRIDRLTAGLVMFSKRPETRRLYQDLFRLRRIEKRYEALAPPLPDRVFPLQRRTRLAPGEPFFRMKEVDGEPNSFTAIDVVERGEAVWRYCLQPETGKKHQLRVHMAGLGAPILGDPLYPDVVPSIESGDYTRPLHLLAKSLSFTDPIDGSPRTFESALDIV
jgi:tRNA pseudouridine32 synthase / 23S rRNA pseudouridine746 synthase